MDFSLKKKIKNLAKICRIKPSKMLGQNFLIDKVVLAQIIKTAELKPDDIILEIGPGSGVLTQELAKRAGKVIAVEKDQKMCQILKETLKNYKNVEIIWGDILKINFQLQKEYKTVANLPYYITSPVIRKFLESENPPKEMVLMVQKEVAQRICASPPKMNLLAVSVQFYAKPEIIVYVSKKSFWPQPKVDSAIIKIKPRIVADNKRIDTDLFFRIVKAGFSQPRKQLANNLSNGLKLNKERVKLLLLKNNIQPSQRAQNLSLCDWLKLVKFFVKIFYC